MANLGDNDVTCKFDLGSYPTKEAPRKPMSYTDGPSDNIDHSEREMWATAFCEVFNQKFDIVPSKLTADGVLDLDMPKKYLQVTITEEDQVFFDAHSSLISLIAKVEENESAFPTEGHLTHTFVKDCFDSLPNGSNTMFAKIVWRKRLTPSIMDLLSTYLYSVAISSMTVVLTCSMRAEALKMQLPNMVRFPASVGVSGLVALSAKTLTATSYHLYLAAFAPFIAYAWRSMSTDDLCEVTHTDFTNGEDADDLQPWNNILQNIPDSISLYPNQVSKDKLQEILKKLMNSYSWLQISIKDAESWGESHKLSAHKTIGEDISSLNMAEQFFNILEKINLLIEYRSHWIFTIGMTTTLAASVVVAMGNVVRNPKLTTVATLAGALSSEYVMTEIYQAALNDNYISRSNEKANLLNFSLVILLTSSLRHVTGIILQALYNYASMQGKEILTAIGLAGGSRLLLKHLMDPNHKPKQNIEDMFTDSEAAVLTAAAFAFALQMIVDGLQTVELSKHFAKTKTIPALHAVLCLAISGYAYGVGFDKPEQRSILDESFTSAIRGLFNSAKAVSAKALMAATVVPSSWTRRQQFKRLL